MSRTTTLQQEDSSGINWSSKHGFLDDEYEINNGPVSPDKGEISAAKHLLVEQQRLINKQNQHENNEGLQDVPEEHLEEIRQITLQEATRSIKEWTAIKFEPHKEGLIGYWIMNHISEAQILVDLDQLKLHIKTTTMSKRSLVRYGFYSIKREKMSISNKPLVLKNHDDLETEKTEKSAETVEDASLSCYTAEIDLRQVVHIRTPDQVRWKTRVPNGNTLTGRVNGIEIKSAKVNRPMRMVFEDHTTWKRWLRGLLYAHTTTSAAFTNDSQTAQGDGNPHHVHLDKMYDNADDDGSNQLTLSELFDELNHYSGLHLDADYLAQLHMTADHAGAGCIRKTQFYGLADNLFTTHSIRCEFDDIISHCKNTMGFENSQPLITKKMLTDWLMRTHACLPEVIDDIIKEHLNTDIIHLKLGANDRKVVPFYSWTDDGETLGLTLYGFSRVIFSRHASANTNTVMRLMDEQTFDFPLTQYWIFTSYNTFMSGCLSPARLRKTPVVDLTKGHRINDNSRVLLQYERALRMGVKCIDIEVWDSPSRFGRSSTNDKKVLRHSSSRHGSTQIKDATIPVVFCNGISGAYVCLKVLLEFLKTCTFKPTREILDKRREDRDIGVQNLIFYPEHCRLPIILHFNLQTSPGVTAEVGRVVKEVLGEHLYPPSAHDCDLSKVTPNLARGKFLIMANDFRLAPLGEDEGEECARENRGYTHRVHRSERAINTFNKSFTPNKQPHKWADDGWVEAKIDDEFKNIRDPQKKNQQLEKETSFFKYHSKAEVKDYYAISLPYDTKLDFHIPKTCDVLRRLGLDEGSEEPLYTYEGAKTSRRLLYNERFVLEHDTNVLLEECGSDRLRKNISKRYNLGLFYDLVNCKSTNFSHLDRSSLPSITGRMKPQEASFSTEKWSAGGSYSGSTSAYINLLHTEPNRQNITQRGGLKPGKPDLRSISWNSLCAVTPDGMRGSSINPNPLNYWDEGVSLVACNVFVEGMAKNLHLARFTDNGGCGYVPKPSHFTDHRAAKHSMEGKESWKLKIRLCEGRMLPRPTCSYNVMKAYHRRIRQSDVDDASPGEENKAPEKKLRLELRLDDDLLAMPKISSRRHRGSAVAFNPFGKDQLPSASEMINPVKEPTHANKNTDLMATDIKEISGRIGEDKLYRGPNPFVVFTLLGDSGEPITKTSRYEVNSGVMVTWTGENEFVFAVKRPYLAILNIEIRHFDEIADELLGSCSIPVTALGCGLRNVPLRDRLGNPINRACLLIHVTTTVQKKTVVVQPLRTAHTTKVLGGGLLVPERSSSGFTAVPSGSMESQDSQNAAYFGGVTSQLPTEPSAGGTRSFNQTASFEGMLSSGTRNRRFSRFVNESSKNDSTTRKRRFRTMATRVMGSHTSETVEAPVEAISRSASAVDL